MTVGAMAAGYDGSSGAGGSGHGIILI